MDICFSHTLSRLIVEPTETTERIKTLVDYILANFSEKFIQSGVTETELSDHQLTYCTRKASLLRL